MFPLARDIADTTYPSSQNPNQHTCGLVLYTLSVLILTSATLKLTLRPSHLLLDPGGALVLGISKLQHHPTL